MIKLIGEWLDLVSSGPAQAWPAYATDDVVIRLPFRPEFCRGPKEPYFHGGVIAALIDLTGHAAVAVGLGRAAPTIDLRIDYLRPASGDGLLATGRVT